MERDTDEWRRPWTADADGAFADGSARRVRRIVRPSPSSLRRDEIEGERSAVRTVTVRPRSDEPTATRDEPGASTPHEPTGHAAAGPPPAHGPAAAGGAAAPRRGRFVLAIALVAALLGGVVGTGATLLAAERFDLITLGGSNQDTGRTGESDAVRSPVVESVEPPQGQSIVTAVAEAVLPSVVRIDVLAERDDPEGGTDEVQIGVGSGVIYRSDGYLLTNNHVVEDADSLTVRFSDGTSAVAEIVGTDPLTDLAVLRVDRDGLPAVNLRQDRALEVGETAIAIGSPFGLDASVTAGVVSALNRDLQVPGDGDTGAFVIPALIQTDAAINPGNSGGALVDASGQLIGINTAILTGSGGSQGVGFAIPTRSAIIAADQLIDRGFVSHPFLGISGLDVTREVESRYRDEFGIELDGGALVDSVVEDSGAALGGIEPGDVIIELGGEPITSMTDVITGILQFDPQESVAVVLLRDGERLEVEVTLGERPR